ncbi:MAG TPA: protein kinase [Polyangiaceae bacterium]|nr:protein kinase [Polyangiaceae bacterium]
MDKHDALVAGRYRLGRMIGMGGMGIVYEAEQLPLRRTVALKMLPRERVGSEDAVERLIEEARALSRIEHPGVVRVIDAGRDDRGQAFLAMEYLEGSTLKQLLALHGPLPWRWVLAVIAQCLEALEVVHGAGFIHRDIKSSNCFCCASSPAEGVPIGTDIPVVKLIDFGIAKAERSRRPADLAAGRVGEGAGGPLLGTPAYWAPEQAQSGQATRRSDIYSIGVTLYELLTGELPSRTDDAGIEPPSAVNPAVGIPPMLDAIVLRALHADSAQRFESAAALLVALREIDGDRDQGTTTWPPPEAPASSRVPPVRPPSTTGTRSGEGIQLQRLRAKVREFWIEGVLRSSLLATLPGPPRSLDQSLVAGLGHELEPPPPVRVAEARSTAEIFEHQGRSLLIVGPAGSGKTTQLLLVARQLLEGGSESVPVVLTLSAWRGERRDLEEWLASELRSKYQVPNALSLSWLRRGLILPLLDGLDEVLPRHRAGVVRAINRAIALGTLPGLLVTTRDEEYLDTGERLGSTIAMRLHQLSSATVDELRAGASPFSRLSADQWGALRPLLDSPLAVSLLSSALGDGTLALDATPRGMAQLDDLLDVYAEQMIKRTGKARLPCETVEFIEFLSQLGHAMRTNDTDIFAPDGVQPSWLEGSRSKLAYALVSRWIGAGIYSASVILPFGLTPLDNRGFHAGLKFGCVLAAFSTLTIGTVHGVSAGLRLISHEGQPLGGRRHWIRVASLAVLSGILNAALVGVWAMHPTAAIMAAEVAVLAAPLLCPHDEIGFSRGDIRLIDRLRFSFRKALRAAVFGVAAGVVAAWVAADDATAMIVVMLYLTSLWFVFGGLRGRQVPDGARPYVGVRHSLSWSFLLGALAVVLTAVPTAMAYGGLYGLYAGLLTGAVLWLWYGGMALVQYVVLRWMLSLQGARFFRAEYLEAAADRALLHRLGSGYLFVHPMLRESFSRRWEARSNT